MGIIKKRKISDPSETTMSLGDHLEDLRQRLIRALAGLLIGTVICLFFGRSIVKFIERPYNKIVSSNVDSQLQDNRTPWTILVGKFNSNLMQALEADPNSSNADPNAADIDLNTLVFVQKVYEETIASLADDPEYVDVINNVYNSGRRNRLIVLAPADPFVGFMKISLISGLLLSSPWVFYQLWMFIAAGLYPNEKRYVTRSVPFSAALFVIGALFFLFVVAPISLRFFLGFGQWMGLSPNWTFQRYISFVTVLMLVFGIAFQTPVIIFVLTRTGLVSIKGLTSSRPYVFLAVFIIAATATPPDIISQVSLAIPLYALFELGILLSWLADRKKK